MAVEALEGLEQGGASRQGKRSAAPLASIFKKPAARS